MNACLVRAETLRLIRWTPFGFDDDDDDGGGGDNDDDGDGDGDCDGDDVKDVDDYSIMKLMMTSTVMMEILMAIMMMVKAYVMRVMI